VITTENYTFNKNGTPYEDLLSMEPWVEAKENKKNFKLVFPCHQL
jgi:hypothetical protein